MRSVLTLASVALISAPSALAQETVTFSFEFDHAVLQPGQAQGIRVYAHFEPGVGAYVPWNTNGGTGQICRVNSFAVAQFNILNVMNAQTGTWSNMYRNPFMLGTTGQVQPSGSVTGIWVFQPGGTYTIANPILLWGGTWTPSSYDPREVRLGTHSNAPPQVFLDVGISSPELDDWTPIEGEGSFQVVPAPGGIGALVAAALFTGRRRRACAMDNATDPSLYVAAKVGVAGTGLHDWLTVKVLDDGTVAWQSALSVAGAGDDQPTAVAVGTRKDLGTLKNFVFVTGYTRTAAQGNRFTTACYEDTGNCPACGVELWVNRTDGTFAAGDDRGVAIITQPTHVTDAPVSAFVTGRLRQAGGDYDIHTMKFQSNPEPPQVPGVPRWEIAFSGPNDDVPVSIWYEPSVWDEEIGQFKPGVFIGGNTVGATTGLDWLTIRYSEITP